MDETTSDGAGSRLAELRASAKGWHGVQLAVLGFIGLCGVLQDTSADAPRWLQLLAGTLVLVALALACAATALVAAAAWPVYAADAGRGAVDVDLHRTARRLRLGIALTFVAVVVLATAATSSWWPRPAGGAASVEVSTSRGSACGELRDGDPGTISLATAAGPVVVPVAQVQTLRPVRAC